MSRFSGKPAAIALLWSIARIKGAITPAERGNSAMGATSMEWRFSDRAATAVRGDLPGALPVMAAASALHAMPTGI
ncbi:hypothetical protein [Roseovarius sp. E0-M6]|uniref:hypothetical protein n=1 Tax=Roseovarius sp. E0-M6 TaxID=3127118 RepID=UPI003010043F